MNRHLCFLFWTFVALFAWLPLCSWAQHEADNWLFGAGVNVRFSAQGLVVVDTSSMDQLEGTACISDAQTGQLLFYSDGQSVWDRTHQRMPNGHDLFGAGTATQSALIVPFPNRPGLYYLFTIRAYNDLLFDRSPGGLAYSLIDMHLRGGLGDVNVSVKNQFIEHFTTEKLTAVPHANGRDYWIVAHGWNSNEFLVYKLTPIGLTQSRKIAIGPVHRAGPVGAAEAMGYLKASPNGRYLAAAVYGYQYERPFELYDFDDRTGTITNFRSLGNYKEQYGVSFSPDNTKLYLSSLYPFDGAYQFDLTNLSAPPIALPLEDTTRSGYVKTYLAGALQLGIDGKLYASEFTKGRLAVVDHPNAQGTAAHPHYLYLPYKGGKQARFGLPNFIQKLFDRTDLASLPRPAEDTCEDLLVVYPNPVVGSELLINVDSTACPLKQLTIYDESGRLMGTYRGLSSSPLKVDVGHWPGALYVLVFEFADRQVVKKVIKQ